jgi:hypothetical protein
LDFIAGRGCFGASDEEVEQLFSRYRRI